MKIAADRLVRLARGAAAAVVRLENGAHVAAAVLIVAYAFLIISDFSRYVAWWPYLAVDDTLANVSYSLARTGRYGFPISPLQGFGKESYRHDAFFNYGPWYFLLGAFLIRVFGYSLGLLRAIHPAGIMFTVAAAYWSLRGTGHRLASFLYAALALYCFDAAQWPMVRPDVMVSVFAVGMWIAAAWAWRTGRAVGWFWAGLCAACGALTHLIAWTLVPVVVVVFVLAHPRVWRLSPSPPFWRRVGALAAGGASGLVMFLAAIRFRIADLWLFLQGYRAFLGETHQPAIVVGGHHLESAFLYLGLASPFRVLVIVPVAIGLMGIALLGRLGLDRRDAECLAAPTVTFALYAASLARYPNYHSGYVILLQVSALWTFAVAVAVAVKMCGALRPWLPALVSVLIVVIVGERVAVSARSKVRFPRADQPLSRQWVRIPDYVDEVLRPLPRGARVWGSTIFGIETPDRLELVQFFDGESLSSRLPAAERNRLAPDYLLWGYPENRDSLLAGLRGSPSRPLALPSASHYEPVLLVNAAPYGVARVYERRAAVGEPDRQPPAVSWQEESGSWSRRLGAPVPLSLRGSEPGRFRVGYTVPDRWSTAAHTEAFDLPVGRYVIVVEGGASAGLRMVCATPQRKVVAEITELGPPFDCAPALPGNRILAVLEDHPGGTGFLTWWTAAPETEIVRAIAYPVQWSSGSEPSVEWSELPPLTRWRLGSPRGKVLSAGTEAIEVAGDGYQLVSPEITVPPHRSVSVELPVEVDAGAVAVGILDDAGRWLVPPTRLAPRLTFDTGPSPWIQIVVAKNRNSPTAATGRLVVRKGRYGVSRASPGWYVDALVEAVRRRSLATTSR